MTQNFSFPPPPPPPPKASAQDSRGHHSQGPSHGQSRGSRGRGRGNNFRGGSNGGGRGRGGHYSTQSNNISEGHGTSRSNLKQDNKSPMAQSSYGYHDSNQMENSSISQSAMNFSPFATNSWLGNGQMYPQQAVNPMAYQPYMNAWVPQSNAPTQQHQYQRLPEVSNNGKRKHEEIKHEPWKSLKSADADVPATAPPVPQFGGPIPQLKSSPNGRRDAGSGSERTHKRAERMLKQKRKINELGLTPGGIDQEESEEEDDADEETRLGSLTQTGPLRIRHKGRWHEIRNDEEMAKWIEERRKNFPTKTKVDQSLKEKRAREQKHEEEQARIKVLESQAKMSEAKERKKKHPLEKSNQRFAESRKEKRMPETKRKGPTRTPRDFSAEIERLQKQLDICESKASQYQSAANGYRSAIASLQSVSHAIAQANQEQSDSDAMETTRIKDSKSTIKGQDPHSNDKESAKVVSHVTPESEGLFSGSPPATSSSSGSESDDSSDETDNNSDAPSEHENKKSKDDQDSHDSVSNQPLLLDSDRVISTDATNATDVVRSASAHLSQSQDQESTQGRSKDSRRMCSHFLRQGYCKFGNRCRYSHDKSQLSRTEQRKNWKERERTSNVHQSQGQNPSETKRKTLHQRMMERQIQHENRLVLDSIKWMGEKGVLSS